MSTDPLRAGAAKAPPWHRRAARRDLRWAALLLAAALALAASFATRPARALPRAPYLDDPLVHPRLELHDQEPPPPRRGSSRMPSLWVAIEAGVLHRSSGEPPSFGAMLLLGAPLDRLALLGARRGAIAEDPRAPAKPPPAPPPPPAPALKPPARAAKLDLPLLSPAPAKIPGAADGAPAPPIRIPIAVTPTVARAAVRAALVHARLADPDAGVDALISRARASAALPELRLRASRTVDEGQALSPTEYDPNRTTATGGTSLWIEARATWKLDRLVFADEEVALERVRHDRAAARARVVTQVLKLLFSWQRALALAENPAGSPEEHLAASLKVLESEAELDIVTDGWFTRWRAKQPGAP